MCFPWQQQSAQGKRSPEATWVCFFVLLRAGSRSLSVFLQLRQIFLLVTTAFVLKIFSFSDKKKVLDVFDRHCWDAACYSRMSEVWHYRCS